LGWGKSKLNEYMDHIIIAQASGIGSIFRVRVPVTVGGKEAPIFKKGKY